ncbi:aspartic proteinase CDR1-like [Vicia villosa]|uniref:aspartic proteinase CDR1-like n=1 Tax=Vicia villosa TaxID=3911 RepID=UPI00273BA0DC|nr:aspartic proteinase CDR1-like [Vicia villosa]
MSSHKIVFFFCLLSFIVSLSHALNGFSVELIHRDSEKSPFFQPNQNKYQSIINAARHSINRANHFYKNAVGDAPQSTILPDGGAYLMTYSVGTPPFKQFGIPDTGSDIVWLQCEPCETCFNQTTPIFKPAQSSTYKNVPCSSDTCQSVRSSSCGGKNNCEYTITYGDGSKSEGDLSVDTVTLESTTGASVSFPKTLIGCGTDNTVSFNGRSSGIVGLAGGPASLITQLGSTIGGKFSYCLPPSTFASGGSSSATSKLNFGDAAIVSGAGVVSTPIITKNDEIFYFLTLESFSVGTKRVEFTSSTNAVGEGGEGNIIIDSGTTLTLLPSEIYSNLEAEVAKVVNLERVDDPNNLFDLCYTITSEEPEFPVITANFQGADVVLQPVSTFVQISDNIACFAFTPAQDLAIFGNLVQQNLLVGYDLEAKKLSFKPTDCSKE